MKVFFDNCTAPVLASTLHGFISHYGHSAFHIKDVPGLARGRSAPDVDWIELLRSAQDTWIFISGDGRILRNPPERVALRSSGLHGFILAPAYQKNPMHMNAALLISRWPDIEQITQILSAPSMHEIPIGKSTKLRALPL
ncbi:hypothetical protein G8E10_10045 [Rhizobiaceae bacterium CRRU44]|uniref:VapC45 PIN like domain-containing protein n=1 Tax=Ferranicluibacter rubi TaxID=2715133 RepID=A0AA43ZDW9_9HYPH|nr:hypothetical protein [Ferranicluibacter rubi]